jgi:quercetin dioxygenase-like cupin family protein
MRFVAYGLLFVILAIGPTLQSAHAEDAKMAHPAAAAKQFVNFPGLPTCAKGSIVDGDPTKSSSVILVKTTTGCVVPWHWHTPTEQLMFVSGSGKGEMKDSGALVLHSGEYVKMPSKSVHQFTCVAACTFFLASDAAFDIHYVDKDGKEVSPDEALKSKAKAKSPMKKEMKDTKM